MPLTYRIDVEHGVVWTHGTGEVTDADVLALKRAIRADPGYRADLRQLSDMRAVERLGVTPQGVMQMAEMDAGHREDNTVHRLAIVAGQDLIYGMARMYQARASEHRPDVGVFRDIAEACGWLGIPAPDGHPRGDR